jgi:pyrroline-5-carboxylate reductase
MKTVGIIGLGNMGEAIARSLSRAKPADDRILGFDVKEARCAAVRTSCGVEVVKDHQQLAAASDYLILAVKPQDAKPVVQGIAPFIRESAIIISIMAGMTTSTITALLEKPARVVRVMPNICVAVGEGALGVAGNYLLSEDDVTSIGALLRPLGLVVDVTEEQMDAVTALGGSGPAFFLSFIEAMIDGGVRMGLGRDKAQALSLQVVKGTVKMLEERNLHPSLMKEMITSPGGTTIAGLVVLDEKGFGANVVRALEAAQARSKELSK